jgi:hypothetical protein
VAARVIRLLVLDTAPRRSVAFLRMPWAPLLPLMVLLPFMLSGAVRFEYGSSLASSLALPAVLCLMVAGWVWTFGLPAIERAQSQVAAPATLASALLLVAFMFELWWTPLFGGLPNTFEGVDLGNHLLIFQRFVKPNEHRQYAGFVSMYAVMYWYRALFAGNNPPLRSYYYALRFAHYAFLLALPVALSLVVYPVLAQVRGTIRALIASVASLPLQLVAFGLLLFPVVQYYQAEGFYAQIAGFYPLLFGFLSYGLIEHAGTRFVLCCFWLVVQRYTYGLNAGECLLVLAYLWLWDARAIRARWLRWGAWAFVPLAVLGAGYVLSRLWQLRHAQGYFIPYPIAWAIGGMLLSSILLLLAPGFFRQRGIALCAASERLWRYAALHGLATGTLMAVYFARGAPLMYFIQKFSLYASVLLALAVVGPLATLLVHLLEHGPRWLLTPDNARFAWGASVFMALGLFATLQGYAVYRPMAQERWRRTTPSAALSSNFEPELDAFMEQTLRKYKREFGGYYDPFWPRMFTHNTLYFQFAHERDYAFNIQFLTGEALFQDRPGFCYFVQGTPGAYLPGPNTEMARQITKFYRARDVCSTFRPSWSERPLTVCAACL